MKQMSEESVTGYKSRLEDKGKFMTSLRKEEEKFDNRVMKPETLAKLRKLLKMEEGYRANAYQDTGGKWTIGYGHTKDVKEGDVATKEQAEKMFEQDIKDHIDPLKRVKVRLSENEKAALSSFVYNIGGPQFYKSTMLKKLNAGDKKGAADEFERFKFVNGVIQPGLIRRRKDEKELFLTPDD